MALYHRNVNSHFRLFTLFILMQTSKPQEIPTHA
nr:MAG TPA: hypothetical protein [Caudoviricetes sp.]DAU06102.1 MAG TPA: hypothetical protein [Caudoviricetes sp.]